MAKVIGIIGARLNSSRLPRKHLLDLAGLPMIAHIFQRLEQIPAIDHLVLATTGDEYNQPLIDWAMQHGKECFAYAGDVNDLTGRVDAVVQHYQPDLLVYFCGDSPLIEPATVERMIEALVDNPQADLVGLNSPPAGKEYIHEGFAVYRTSVWQRIVDQSDQPADREHVGYALRKFAGQLSACHIPEDPVYYRRQHRISVDTPSDYAFMHEVYARWYALHDQRSIVSLPWVIEQLTLDPALAAINQHVQQKGAEEVAGKVLMLVHAGPGYGLGHIKRSLEVVRALQDRHKIGVKLVLIGADASLYNVLPELRILPHDLLADADKSYAGLQALIDKESFQVLVTDLRRDRLTSDFSDVLEGVKRRGAKIVAIDGLKDWEGLVDLACFPSFFLSEDNRKRLRPDQLAYGWGYYLVKAGVCKPVPGRRVLIATGGGDPTGLAGFLPRIVDQAMAADVEVHWIQGPYASPPTLPDQPRLKWYIHESPTNLVQTLQDMSHVLSVYGVTFFEALACGLPAVVFSPYATTDSQEWQALRASGVACVADNVEQAVDALAQLVTDISESERLGRAGRQKIDGLGASRLAQRIAGLCTH